MRLSPCPTCRLHVDADARTCAHCHAPLRATLAAAAGAVVLGLSAFPCEANATSTGTGTDTDSSTTALEGSTTESSSTTADGGATGDTTEDTGVVVEPHYGTSGFECSIPEHPASPRTAALAVLVLAAARRRRA